MKNIVNAGSASLNNHVLKHDAEYYSPYYLL